MSSWINGKYEPSAITVFGIERVLALEPGHLSRPLGYLPVDAVETAVGVEGVILQSTELDDEQKDVLVALYHVLTERHRAASSGLGAAPTGAPRPHSVAGRG